METRLRRVTTLALLALAATACAAPPSETGRLVYRTVGDRDLAVEVFAPEDATQGADLPALVLFHGGAWLMGSPVLVHPMARYFASRSMVAVAVEYRLSDEGEVTPVEAMDDANHALAWVRNNAHRLGVDPTRIAAGGYSAGGHLATMAAISADGKSGLDHRPDALVLWFPALAAHTNADFLRLLQDRADPATLSPADQVRPGLPPTIILQGSRDRVTRQADARRFCEQMTAAGNRCDLHVYKNRSHMFTNDLEDYVDTIVKIDTFFGSIGFLEGVADPEEARKIRSAAQQQPPA